MTAIKRPSIAFFAILLAVQLSLPVGLSWADDQPAANASPVATQAEPADGAADQEPSDRALPTIPPGGA